MLTNHQMRSYSATDLSQMELADELTRLNTSLKVELQKCYKYIQTLEKDLNAAQERSNLSVASQRIIYEGDIIEQERNKLKEEVGRLSAKVKQKRGLAKSLQKHCQGLEIHLNQSLIEKEQLQVSLSNMQFLLDSGIRQDKDKITMLQKVAAEQRDTIQLYSKQLQGKAVTTQKLYIKIQDFERQCVIAHKQNEQLRQINQSLTQKLQQLQRRSQERELKASNEIRQLESKIFNLNDQISKLNALISRTDLLRNSSVSSFEGSPRAWPISKRISIEEHSASKNMEVQRFELLNQIQLLQQEKQKEKERVDRLKSDIITIKLQQSSLLTKNSQLYQQKSNLEKIKNQLMMKLEGGNTMRSTNQTQRSIEVNSFHSVKSSGNKTIGSIGSISTRRPFNSPKDGQIPVLDKGSIKGQYIYMSSNRGDSHKNNISYRQSTVNFTSLR